VILSRGSRLRFDLALPSQPAVMRLVPTPREPCADDVVYTDEEWRAGERQNLIRALQRSNGRIYGPSGAAELLGVNPTTLASRLRAHKIDAARPR
jgi:transcriptional regulator with GAF, ATPase, and Fis domain